MNSNLIFLLNKYEQKLKRLDSGSGWTRAERFKFKHLENKKRAQAAGPVQKGIYFKGGQFPLSYTIFISLLLQESYKKVTLLIYILLF
ncbi:hypothetical protein FB550_110133 [Neobacillus bataviensis]|uniref:Uncharacterized protein n=1 Tax=Neobacillus bataviensis TaxID=220685 RepID=A0A561D354_9BACI|nr:hypothetical protein [Neobacillus bataviensis]TWD97528.1 hypothetical protein FB550_110133 [Neobacillus bataviensis]